MRTQWCRDHIDEVALNCGLSKSTKTLVKAATAFVDKNPSFAECPTDVISTILSIKDPKTKGSVIEETSGILSRRKPDGSWVKRKFTAPEVKIIIQKHKIANLIKPEEISQPSNKKPRNIGSQKCRVLVEDLADKEDLAVLRDLISKGYASDEYEAYLVVIKWAAERIAKEKK